MNYFRKIGLLSLCILSFALTGCGKSESIKTPSITFIEYKHDSSTNYDGFIFCDDKGNKYESLDADIASLPYEELLLEFSKGILNERIEAIGTCDAEELKNQYELFYKNALNDDFYLEYSMFMPDVEAPSGSIYGVYYDENNELRTLVIHEYERNTEINSTNEEINQIYDWYKNAY